MVFDYVVKLQFFGLQKVIRNNKILKRHDKPFEKPSALINYVYPIKKPYKLIVRPYVL